jgi:excisionase family DNA binding protein
VIESYTVDDLARALQATASTVRKWTASGLIPGAYKSPGGGEWRFLKGAVDAWIARRAQIAEEEKA